MRDQGTTSNRFLIAIDQSALCVGGLIWKGEVKDAAVAGKEIGGEEGDVAPGIGRDPNDENKCGSGEEFSLEVEHAGGLLER